MLLARYMVKRVVLKSHNMQRFNLNIAISPVFHSYPHGRLTTLKCSIHEVLRAYQVD
jgi:hypothetical protein